MFSSALKHKETGNQFVAEGKYIEALEQYELAIKCDPTLAAAWFNKGIMLKKIGHNDEAILAFEKTLALDKDYKKARQNLASILLDQKKYEQARPHFYKLNPLSPETLKCQQKIGAKIIFANVDLKLTHNNVIKILEFGNGMASGFTGFDVLSDGKRNMADLLISELKTLKILSFQIKQ